MATNREQIEHIEYWSNPDSETPWKNFSRSRKQYKKSMNRYMRRQNKKISEDDYDKKRGKRPYSGWEF